MHSPIFFLPLLTVSGLPRMSSHAYSVVPQVLSWASFTKSQILKIAPCAQCEIKSCLAEADEKWLVASAPLFRKSALLLTPFLPFPSPILNRHNNLDKHQIPLSVQIFDGTEFLWTQ